MNSEKIALVTGGTGSIGLEICKLLSKNGFLLYAGTRKKDEYEKDSIKTIYLDVNNDESVRRAVSSIISKEGRIDILINCAGYAQFGALETLSMEQAKNQFETNFFGVARCIKEVLPLFRKQNQGTIINISSSAGLRGREACGIYSASKFAVEGLSESLWWELRPFNIAVKVVEPSATKGKFQDNMLFGEHRIKEYEGLDDDLKSYFSTATLLEAEDVAKVVLEAVQDKSERFRYQIGSSLEIAKEKLREPALIMKRYPFVKKAIKYAIKKMRL
jgi:short-subunit dehydrogenase